MKYPNGYFRDKLCKTCKTKFTPTNPCQLYCCKSCRGLNSYYKRNYGFDEAELNRMREGQSHLCAICNKEGFMMDNTKHNHRLVVDHCHETGTVRKLLCHNCNRGLGLFQDSPEYLRIAANYIEDHRQGATTIQ